MRTPAKKTTTSRSKRAQSSQPAIAFEKFTLQNGLQVIFHIDRKLPVVHVNHWFHVGSKNEKPGHTGFAHLFEHLMFQGSLHAKGDYFAFVEKAGANLREGGVNGTTSEDRTNYFVTVPSGNLEHILWLESDRIATLADSLTQTELDNQREVVRNERRQGLENQPYGRAFKLIVENLFPHGHPYSWPVIGSHEDLIAASMEDVKEFFKTYYTPNNLSLCIAGDFDPQQARSLVEKYYGSLQPGPALDRPGTFLPVLDGEKIVEVQDRVPQERAYIAWPAPRFFAPGEAELTLASLILSDGLSSRLNRKLVYDRQLCSNVSSFNDASEIAGLFLVMATARTGSPLAAIEQIVTEEIDKLSEQGPTTRELARAKTKWEYDYISGLERIGGFGGKADRLNAYNTYLGDPDKFAADLERYRSVSPSSMKNAVGQWLATRGRLLVRFHPEMSRRAETKDPDRSLVPSLGADKHFVVPEVQSTKLENGLDVFVIERHDLPKVSVALVTKAGSIRDPLDKMGVAQLVIQTIDRGTKSRKALDIEDALGDLGTSLQGMATKELSSLALDVLAKNLKPALAILSDTVTDAAFPSTEFEREKELHLDALQQDKNNPNAIASRIRPLLAFGPAHRYGRPSRGFPATVRSITREDVVRFHDAFWKPNCSALVFSGDVTLKEATELAQKNFGSWTAAAQPDIQIEAPHPAGYGKVFLVDRQDAAQTVVSQVLPGPSRLSEDYYALKLADAVWGGGFMNRLNLNLREDKGYTYGASSSLALFSRGGYWFSSASVQSDKTKESVTEFVRELNDLAGGKPISEQELSEAKANKVRGFAQQFESLGRIAGIVAELWSYGLPATELQKEPDEFTRVTLESANSIAQKYAQPGRSMLLMVGDRAKIETSLRELNVGELIILDDEGRITG
ncbi:MAG TPA: pitrilysin family protein [Bacteroidota bacterium]